MTDSNDTEGGDDGTASFYEASSALEKEEEDRRMQETGLGLSDEVSCSPIATRTFSMSIFDQGEMLIRNFVFAIATYTAWK